MASPYAAGLGGFMNGVAQGLQIGKVLRGEMDKWDAQKEREAAVSDAKKQYVANVSQREREIAGDTQPQGTADANGVTVTPVAQRDMTVENMPPAAGQGGAPQAPSQGATPASAAGTTPATAAPPTAPAAAAPVAAQGLPPQQAVTERVIETPGANPQGQRVAAAQTREIAQAGAGSEREAIDKAVSARMRDYYINKGDLETADKWDQYAETREAKRQINNFGKALRSASVGDHAGVIKHITPVLEENFGQGFKIQNTSPVKDKEGNVTGYNFEVRNTRTGEVTQNNLTNEGLYQVAMTMGSPQQGFDRWMKAKQDAATAKAKATEKAGEIKMQTAKEIAVEQARQGGRVQLEGVKAQNQGARDSRQHENNLERDVQKGQIDSQNQRNKVQQELDAKVGALQKAGYSEEFIKNALPDILGVNQYKKTTSPEEAKRLAMSDRMKSDPSFARKSPEQQRQIIEQDMSLIYGGVKPTNTPSADKPAASATPPAARGLPVLDQKTGKVIYRE